MLVAGVVSMGFEILAGRLLAPAFGSSVFTWGAVIGVFLTALSLGYALGGRRAPAHASGGGIARVLVYAAGFVAVVALAGDLVIQLGAALPVPARFAPIVPVAVLFGPPTFALGFVSPYAAELSGRRSTGSASGRVYAVGTVGSIVGAFATTFVLVPALGVLGVELGFGALLLFGAALVVPGSDVRGWTRIVVAALVLVGTGTVAAYGVTPGSTVVYETQTTYQHLVVADDHGVRTLYLDGVRHSATYTDGRQGCVFSYTRYFHLPMLFAENVDRVLFVGGGGFSGPKRFLAEYPNVTVDVVEIDPAVVGAARRYFDVPDSPRLNVHVEDGRRFLESTNRTYDVIFLDAFRKDRVPFHLTTVEFMRLVRDHLDSDGVVLANVISATSGSGSAFYRAEVKTLEATFPRVYSFPTTVTPFLQNIELVATVSDRRLTESALARRNDRRDVGLDLSAEVHQYVPASEIDTTDVPVLRDDHAPVDELLASQVGRRYVVVENGTTSGTNGTRTNGTGTVAPARRVGVPAAG